MSFVPQSVLDRYEVVEDRHALAVLHGEFKQELDEVFAALDNFSFSNDDVLAGGGSESNIPKNFKAILEGMNWDKEVNLHARMLAGDDEVLSDTHKIDYPKGKVACDMEWNSKDQTFDRDLFAFRTFFEFRRISVGILVTRSTSLQELFKELGVGQKYGASTTHMNKLTPRLQAGRNGGCPVVAFGITAGCYVG